MAKLRANFEGKEAIYFEKGALLVRVSDIRQGLSTVAAQIEEIPTPGMVGFIGGPQGKGPLRWTIRAGQFNHYYDLLHTHWLGPAAATGIDCDQRDCLHQTHCTQRRHPTCRPGS